MNYFLADENILAAAMFTLLAGLQRRVVDGHTCLPDKYLCKRHTHALCGRPSVAVHFNSIQPTSPQSLPCRSFLKKFHPFF